MSTILESSWDMKEPMVVLVSTTYLYFIGVQSARGVSISAAISICSNG